MSGSGSIAQDLYDSAAEFGLQTRKWLFISLTFLFCVAIFNAFVFYFKNKRTESVDASLQNITCTAYDTPGKTVNGVTTGTERKYRCEADQVYVVKGQSYTVPYKYVESANPSDKMIASKITLYYNPDNPTDIGFGRGQVATVAWIISAILFIAVVVTGIQYWLATKVKLYSAYEGASTAIGIGADIGTGVANAVGSAVFGTTPSASQSSGLSGGAIGGILFAFVLGFIFLIIGVTQLFS